MPPTDAAMRVSWGPQWMIRAPQWMIRAPPWMIRAPQWMLPPTDAAMRVSWGPQVDDKGSTVDVAPD
eukprot:11331-Prorocentrum_minimum.AAC.1